MVLLLVALAGCTASPEDVVNAWIDAGPEADTNPCPKVFHPAYALGMQLSNVTTTVELLEKSDGHARVRYTLNADIHNESLDTKIGSVDVHVGNVDVSGYERSGEVQLQKDGRRWRVHCVP